MFNEQTACKAGMQRDSAGFVSHCPLVVFLHGAGTRSENTETLRNNENFLNIKKRQTREYIVLAPLCSVNNWNEVMSSLIRLVDFIRSQKYIDTTRVHLTGNSMGGYGTWELASLRPDWFASIMPVCGGGIKWIRLRIQKHISITNVYINFYNSRLL